MKARLMVCALDLAALAATFSSVAGGMAAAGASERGRQRAPPRATATPPVRLRSEARRASAQRPDS